MIGHWQHTIMFPRALRTAERRFLLQYIGVSRRNLRRFDVGVALRARRRRMRRKRAR